MASAISFGDGNSGFQAGIINGSVYTSLHPPAGKFAGAVRGLQVQACANTLPHLKSDQRLHPVHRP